MTRNRITLPEARRSVPPATVRHCAPLVEYTSSLLDRRGALGLMCRLVDECSALPAAPAGGPEARQPSVRAAFAAAGRAWVPSVLALHSLIAGDLGAPELGVQARVDYPALGAIAPPAVDGDQPGSGHASALYVLSFGAPYRLLVPARHAPSDLDRCPQEGEQHRLSLLVEHGSLLVLRGPTAHLPTRELDDAATVPPARVRVVFWQARAANDVALARW
jgi:hypothetical protein